jgi:hypothetical protein
MIKVSLAEAVILRSPARSPCPARTLLTRRSLA